MLTMFTKALGVILLLVWVLRDHYFGWWLLIPAMLISFQFTVKQYGTTRWL